MNINDIIVEGKGRPQKPKPYGSRNPVAKNIEAIATTNVAANAARLINSVFLLGINAISNALISGSAPTIVNRFMRSPPRLQQ